MTALTYGMQYPGCSFSAGPHPRFEELALRLGWSMDNRRPVAAFRLYGIEVIVYDRAIASEIHEMAGVGAKGVGQAVEMEPYLERILFTALQQNPMYLEYALKDAYNLGVIAGRSHTRRN
jgi:hypothetical protein